MSTFTLALHNGLAYGQYAVTVIQLDKEGKTLFASEDMKFVIGNGGYGPRTFIH